MLVPGEFNNDEPTELLEKVRSSKSAVLKARIVLPVQRNSPIAVVPQPVRRMQEVRQYPLSVQ